MRLLLDECMPRRFRQDLSGHYVRTVQEMGWSGLKNGALLRQAAPLFDALVTVDRGIFYQQNLTGATISVVILLSASNGLDALRPFLPALQTALNSITPGQVVRISL
jgi:hypothetical protein